MIIEIDFKGFWYSHLSTIFFNLGQAGQEENTSIVVFVIAF